MEMRPSCAGRSLLQNTQSCVSIQSPRRRLFVGHAHMLHTQLAMHVLTHADVNPVYTKRIVGFDQEESDYLLHFLFDHIAKRADFQCRVRYEAGTVLVWDQRVTNHSQTLDYPAGERRHGFRLTPLAEKPVPSMVEEDDGECAKDFGRSSLGLC
jgi:hypothetical protein